MTINASPTPASTPPAPAVGETPKNQDALSAFLSVPLGKGPIGAISVLVEKGTATALLVVGLALSWLIGSHEIDSSLKGADYGLALGAAVLLALGGAAYNAYTYKRSMDAYDAKMAAQRGELAAAAWRRDARQAARELTDSEQMAHYEKLLRETGTEPPPKAP